MTIRTVPAPKVPGPQSPPCLGLDVVVPIYANAHLARTCVESLLANWTETDGRGARLVLVNDSPDDIGVNSLLADWPSLQPHVDVLVNEHNLGFVRSINRALARCAAEHRDALIVNADTVTFAGTIAQLLNAVSQDPHIGFASPRSNNAAFCSLPALPFPQSASASEARENWLQLSRTLPDFHFVPTAVGFYMFIAHGVLCDCGLLDEAFGSGYEEENDLVLRARRGGWRAVVVNRAFAYHVGAASFGIRPREDLLRQQHANHLRLLERHPSFRGMMDRYESSSHFRAELLLTGLLPSTDGRRRVVFDFADLVAQDLDAVEFAVALLGAFATAWRNRFEVVVTCSESAWRSLGQAGVPGLRWKDPATPGLSAVAVRIGAPRGLADLLRFEALAPLCLYAMFGTDAEDAPPVPTGEDLTLLWDHVAEHASALVFPGTRSRRQFAVRHPQADWRRTWAAALPTLPAPSADSADAPAAQERSVAVAGDADGLDDAAAAAFATLAVRLPARRFEWLGTGEGAQRTPDGSGHPQGSDGLGRRIGSAAAVVLPSRRTGFGRVLVHALHARRPVVLRRSAAMLDLLDAAGQPDGVWTVELDSDWPAAIERALHWQPSPTVAIAGTDFATWADGIAGLALEVLDDDKLFDALVRRIASADMLAARSSGPPRPPASPPGIEAVLATPLSLAELLATDGRTFVEHAYATLLRRPVDPSGLAFYASQLEKGVTKTEVLRALHDSPEGRRQAVQLAGLHDLLAAPLAPAPRSGARRWWRS